MPPTAGTDAKLSQTGRHRMTRFTAYCIVFMISFISGAKYLIRSLNDREKYQQSIDVTGCVLGRLTIHVYLYSFSVQLVTNKPRRASDPSFVWASGHPPGNSGANTDDQ